MNIHTIHNLIKLQFPESKITNDIIPGKTITFSYLKYTYYIFLDTPDPRFQLTETEFLESGIKSFGYLEYIEPFKTLENIETALSNLDPEHSNHHWDYR